MQKTELNVTIERGIAAEAPETGTAATERQAATAGTTDRHARTLPTHATDNGAGRAPKTAAIDNATPTS